MSKFYYPLTAVTPFHPLQGRGSCYQQFASAEPSGLGSNRFVVIFDEDVDFRVFDRIEALFSLSPKGKHLGILAVGERKGSLTIVFKEDAHIPDIFKNPSKLSSDIHDLCSDGDYWSVFVYVAGKDYFREYAASLAHPPLSQQAFMEAITWRV